MATLVPFLPSPISAFRFSATFDDALHDCIVHWNVVGQRWYLTVVRQDGTRIVTIARVASPDNYDIDLIAGYFASTMVFRQSSQMFEINP
jgi:hypothetical protein